MKNFHYLNIRQLKWKKLNFLIRGLSFVFHNFIINKVFIFSKRFASLVFNLIVHNLFVLKVLNLYINSSRDH